MINNYTPPKQLQHKQIWSLCLSEDALPQKLKGTTRGKLSEYNYTKKKMPPLSWPALVKRYNNNPQRFSGVVGIVSEDIVTIDVDQKEIPPNVKSLLQSWPTFFHPSFSGSGWHIYYHCPEAISGKKKCRKFKHEDVLQGEVMQGMFVTASSYDPDNFNQETIAKITREELAEFIPEVNRSLKPRKINGKNNPNAYKYLDPEKLKQETKAILNKIPVDPDHLIQIVFETKLTDAEFSSYNYWLTVAQALAHLSIQLASSDPTSTEYFADLFHKWSQTGRSYKGQNDCDEKFYSCIESTQNQESTNVTFDTLRKIAHNYKIPWSEFTKLKFNKKGECTGVDPTDPRNYRDVISWLKLKLVQTSNETYIQGPASVIQHYFSDKQQYYLTQDNDLISVPFSFKYKSDDALTNRLIVLFREMGIEGVMKNHPMFAGFQMNGIEKIDLLYNWMTTVPWDKTPRIEQMIKDSIDIDKTIAEEAGVPVEFYYYLIQKHLTHMAGLRAKVFRFSKNQELVQDNFKKTESCLILAGYQRTGKSTWVESLVPFRANASISVTPASAKTTLEMQRALTNTFVYNIDEIDDVLERMDPGEFKSVITQEKDSFRTMYSQKTDSHLRASGFFGTTNAKHLRLDRTGNRRIWLIPVLGRCDATPFFSCNYQQVWAELLYKAEQLDGSTWGITAEDERLINQTANVFMKQSAGVKMLDLQLSGQEEEADTTALYSSEEVNFELLLSNLKQLAWRGLNGKCFFAVRGQKAFKHLQAQSTFNEDIKFSLKSFSYEIADFCDNHFGWANKTLKLGNHVYKNGILQVYTGKPKRTPFHFLPYKQHIDKAVEEGLIAPEVFYHNKENKMK